MRARPSDHQLDQRRDCEEKSPQEGHALGVTKEIDDHIPGGIGHVARALPVGYAPPDVSQGFVAQAVEHQRARLGH